MNTIEYALLCRSVSQNDDGTLEFHGVSSKFPVLAHQATSLSLVVKLPAAAVAEVVVIHDNPALPFFRSLSYCIRYPFNKREVSRLVENVLWREQYFVMPVQVELAERGQYTVEILDDLVLVHSFSFSVI